MLSLSNISIAIALLATNASTYSIRPSSNHKDYQSTSRKAFLQTCTSTLFTVSFLGTSTKAAEAFDGSGSSAYAGKNPASKLELKKSYQTRVIADVKDFKTLGVAIDNGQTDGDAWVSFFIEYPRRESDSVGRTYSALVDLIGGGIDNASSGCGLLLAASYAKPGKPSDGIPSVKKYNSMAKLFSSIKDAGKRSDVGKSKIAWVKAKDALQEYLETVDLPPSLADPIYDL